MRGGRLFWCQEWTERRREVFPWHMADLGDSWSLPWKSIWQKEKMESRFRIWWNESSAKIVLDGLHSACQQALTTRSSYYNRAHFLHILRLRTETESENKSMEWGHPAHSNCLREGWQWAGGRESTDHRPNPLTLTTYFLLPLWL